MKKKLLAIALLAVVLVVCLTGCDGDNADSEKYYTEQLMQQMTDEIGMPEITNFYEKKMAKEIYELRDDSNLICYAYSRSSYSGKFVYLGQCKGYGLPYSTQYTNPEVFEGGSSDYAHTIRQADPNGLYSGDGLSSTWLYLIDEKTGESVITYIESQITVTQYKLPKRLIEEWSLPENY